jgi:hypothetical protein
LPLLPRRGNLLQLRTIPQRDQLSAEPMERSNQQDYFTRHFFAILMGMIEIGKV